MWVAGDSKQKFEICNLPAGETFQNASVLVPDKGVSAYDEVIE